MDTYYTSVITCRNTRVFGSVLGVPCRVEATSVHQTGPQWYVVLVREEGGRGPGLSGTARRGGVVSLRIPNDVTILGELNTWTGVRFSESGAVCSGSMMIGACGGTTKTFKQKINIQPWKSCKTRTVSTTSKKIAFQENKTRLKVARGNYGISKTSNLHPIHFIIT